MIHMMVIVKENMLVSVTQAFSEQQLETLFAEEIKQYGVEATDVDYENGYVELECGTTICMTHV